jgi:hypothetical protein
MSSVAGVDAVVTNDAVASEPTFTGRQVHVRQAAAKVYAGVTSLVIAFQLALALGAPWGAYAMGGAFPGQYPPVMRMGAVIQAMLLAMMATVVVARAGLALPRWSQEYRWMIWLVVGMGGLGLVLNLITPSAGERMIWVPVAFVQLVCSLAVATGKQS